MKRLAIHAGAGACAIRTGTRDMRSLLKTFGIALTLVIAVGGLPAESRAARATARCPATAQAGQQLAVGVTIDVGMSPLGAYKITVDYDPTVLAVASVAGGSTAEFSRAPTTNTTAPGTTNVKATLRGRPRRC